MRSFIGIIVIALIIPAYCYANNFFEQRYRGWLWFEEIEKQEALEKQQQELMEREKIKQQQEQAKQEVKAFAKELKALRYMMIRYPDNLEHVLAYKKKEVEMMAMALQLDHSYRMVNFTNPNHIDLLTNPTNLYGRKIKKELDEQEQQEKIKQLANTVELFLIFSDSCPYCKQLEPVLSTFAKKYNFKVEAVSIDNSSSQYFKTHHNPLLVQKLEVMLTPTIIVVTNDSLIRFELMRGAASIPELEERAALALEFINKLKKDQGTLQKNINY